MQKVEGSSPFSRLEKARKSGPFVCSDLASGRTCPNRARAPRPRGEPRSPRGGLRSGDRDGVDGGVGRGPGGDLVVVVCGAGLAAGLAEPEAGGLEDGDGVEDLVEAGRAGGGE